eukprot:TRINITY_DN2266_c0_g1_i1.p1 TRINITY_DN2266_c0_g1~~TRINITY_DN2266_c0_g1_i1.p1  ORF type:complete len:359 (-),score=38.18 TRINITY_DN2266_c0_g1_i1:287-1363(-)
MGRHIGNSKSQQATNMDNFETEMKNHPRYDFVKGLNQGAFGSVILCHDKTHDKQVAVKLLPRGRKSVTKYVVREIMNHRVLQHDHVIRYKDVSLTKSYLALAMEYADKGDLFDYVIGLQGLDENKARWFFQQLIIAVDYCHRRGVAIRDIKLENILLHQTADQRLILKVCDFGYSKNKFTQSTATSRVGTPAYLAPEVIQCEAGQKYDAYKADIWSCGVALYVMLTACYPFERAIDKQMDSQARLQAMLQRIVKVDFFIPTDFNFSEDVKSLLAGMLELDLQKRLTIDQIIAHPWFVVGLPPSVFEWNHKLLKKKPDLEQTDDEVYAVVMEARENVQLDEDEDEQSPKEILDTYLGST